MASLHGAAELRGRSALPALVALHIALIIASNYLVQLPFELWGFHTTWGAFTFPLIFVATDLTVRLLGEGPARRVIARVMLPALLASYVVSVLFHEGVFAGWAALGEFNVFVFRIALASFAARHPERADGGERHGRVEHGQRHGERDAGVRGDGGSGEHGAGVWRKACQCGSLAPGQSHQTCSSQAG